MHSKTTKNKYKTKENSKLRKSKTRSHGQHDTKIQSKNQQKHRNTHSNG